MDTKWRRFSRSRAVKVMLVLMYIACFAAVGIITGYAPANGYGANEYTYCVDSVLSDDYMESEAFANKLMNDYWQAQHISAMSYRHERFRTELDKLSFSCVLRIDCLEYNNYKQADYTYRVEFPGDGFLTSDNSTVPRSLQQCVLGMGGLSVRGDYIQIGYSEEQLDSWARSWSIMRYNTQIILWSSLALIVAGIVLMILICRVSGETADGSVSWSKTFALPYELSLLVTVGYGVLYVWMMLDWTENMYYSRNGRAFFMFLCGAVVAGMGASLLYTAVSYSLRRKNNTALRGSLVCLASMLIIKLLKLLLALLKKLGDLLLRFLGFIKELFTGELYKGDTVARRLILLDAAFILVSVILMVFVLVSESLVLVLLELVFFGLFCYGRVLLMRDEAKLEKQISMIYSGNYDYEPAMSKNSPYQKASAQLSAISEQYRKGIEETVKAERTKMELVTNVSHDLKTPLTSIIGYIELLAKEELPGEAAEHVRILQMKSERLKNIVSDVFELAKTTSGEIRIEKEPLDLTKLSYQTLGEMEDKISASGLDIKVNICEPPVTVISDGKRLYRVIQNLLDNALKYSLQGTRIYYILEKRGDKAYITIKNIASYEMNFTKEEILERFTRGDKARSTEGTGLGLSIAQGFALACGGTFDIDIDGDMFKVMLSFPVEAVNTEKTVVTADG